VNQWLDSILGIFISLLLVSSVVKGETLKERSWTVVSQHVINPFQPNPAATSTKESSVHAFQLSQTEESSYIFNPNNNPSQASHTTEVKDLALGGQYPLGGAAVAYQYDKNTRSIAGKIDNRSNRTFKEEFLTKEHKLRFLVDLTNEWRAGFSFRYQTLEADLLGAYNLNDQDHTRYSGSRSGYSLGFFYQLRGMGVGLYTAPALRGKAEVEGEQKIVADPGQDGLDFVLDANDRLKLKLAVNRWTYKKDDRDDAATSPMDQRGIFLRGLELDQYYRKTQAIALGMEYFISPIVALKASYQKQSGVFLFDQNLLPNKNPDLETSVDYGIFRGGISLRNKEFMAEAMLVQSKREKDSIRVQRGDVNLNTVGSYQNKTSAVLLSLGFGN
jgi:hypothetical protein